jgi:hypothetical protein
MSCACEMLDNSTQSTQLFLNIDDIGAFSRSYRVATALVNSRAVMLSIRIISSAIRWHSCFIRPRDACTARINFAAPQACALVLLPGLNGPIQRAKPKIDFIHEKCLRILAYR